MTHEKKWGVRVGVTMFAVGILSCGIGFLFPVMFPDSPLFKLATPFFFVALILSLPTAALLNLLSFGNPAFIILAMPASLAINCTLAGAVVTGFLKLKRFTDHKVYGEHGNQQGCSTVSSEGAPSEEP